MVTWNKTKIIATIGPASNNRKTLRNMLLAGVDIFRLNGAHGTTDEHRETIRMIRDVSEKAMFPAAILLDLPGPKIRIGMLKIEPIRLKCGDAVTLEFGKQMQTGNEIPVPMRQIVKNLRAGSKIYLNDGIIELAVTRIRRRAAECLVKAGGELVSHKGVNLPNTKLDIPSLTEKDKRLLEIAIEEKVDYVGLSFVRSSKNILTLKRILKRHAPEISVIAKIEKPEALKDIDDIINASDAVMIARGDLGIEIRHDKVPAIQREIIRKCMAARKPSITATQMLESMIKSKTPTRAEASDIANAVWEGSDAIMLSAETSVGKFPTLAVREMAKIAREAERHMPSLCIPPPDKSHRFFHTEAISRAAVMLAVILNANAIVTPTRTGQTALCVSKQRPEAQIIAPAEDKIVARRMGLFWGVRPLIMPEFNTVDQLLKHAEKLALKSKLIRKGDTIIITSGAHGRKGDITRLIEVRQVGE